MADKTRLDCYLAEHNLIETREKAKAYILCGYVFVDGKKVDKPSILVSSQNSITIKQPECAFVSRGGQKLKKALDLFQVDVKDKTAVDIGSSTGGFTDCLLKYGAKKVYAVDVGYGQLDWRLRNDPRVVVMERQNARLLKREQFEDELDFAVADVSFISLKLILPIVSELLTQDGEIVSLIKPQFEAGRSEVGKKGVVRDPVIHQKVLESIVSFASSIGFIIKGVTFSPVQGPNGNIEYLTHFIKKPEPFKGIDLQDVVKSAHNHFKNTKTD